MKKILAPLLLACLALWGGIQLGRTSPGLLPDWLNVDTADAAQDNAAAAEEGGDDAIPLESMNLLATDPPDTVYTLSISESLNQAALDTYRRKLDDALYKSAIIETVDRHGNQWFVLTSGEYASREEAQRAANVLFASLGLSAVTRKLPPAPAGAAP